MTMIWSSWSTFPAGETKTFTPSWSVNLKGQFMLTEKTTTLKAEGRKALVPFFTAGYPNASTTLALVQEAAKAGADFVELGIPFSDPVADGSTIQRSSQRALQGGMTLKKALDLCAQLQGQVEIPLILMSYANPILALGIQTFAKEACLAGVQGVILPDVPLEESAPFSRALNGEGLALIQLLAPTTGSERATRIAQAARGFLYAVSVTGITGGKSPCQDTLKQMAQHVGAQSSVPLYAGFGISTPEHAALAGRHCDGVIVGSALIREFDEAGGQMRGVEKVGGLLRQMRQALDQISEPKGAIK
jgi:tryptophan synthase alpha chain